MRRLLSLFVAAVLLATCVFPTQTAPAASPAATARRQLNTRLPEVKLSGVALIDALDFLRDISGLNLTVNWKALEQAGVTRQSPITVRLRAVTLRKALQTVLGEAAGAEILAFDIDQGVVEVTTRELADQRMVTKVYPVEDLLMDIPDFTDAPSFDLTSLSNQGNQNGSSGGGVGGSSGGSSGSSSSGSSQGLFGANGSSNQNNNNSQTGPSKQERATQLVELIRSVIHPDIWVENGGKASIRYFSGSLIITAPRSVHEAIGGPID